MIEVKQLLITKEIVDAWFAEWEALSETIHAAHDARDRTKANELMAQGIALYERLLVESSEAEEVAENDFELYPINGKERFQFIRMRPGQFACYRQLDELFKETKKRAARLRIKK